MSKDKERDQVLGHADESDGIEEYDNPLPTWWLGLFYFTIIWGVAYGIHYHFIAEKSQQKMVDQEFAAAEARWPQASRATSEFAMTEEAVEAGEQVYTTNCVSCHGENLQGGIGPNLVDAEWIHGGTPEDVVRTITEGVPDKGMLTWGPILGAEKINQVAAYVLHENEEALGIEGDDDDEGDDED